MLQEDLNKSQLQKEALCSVPDGFGQGLSTDPQASRWESRGSKQAAGGLQERRHGFTKLQSQCCFKEHGSAIQEEVQKNIQEPSSQGTFPRTSEKESSWWVQDARAGTQKDFWRHPAQNTSPCFDPSGHYPEAFLEANTGSPDAGGHVRLTSTSFTQQDLSAISFFQFQLHREESLLRNIPADKLLAPDENGNRSPLFPIEIHCFLIPGALLVLRLCCNFSH